MLRSFPLEVKAVEETGQFEGILSVYNVVDLGKDLVEPGAFTRTLAAGTERPLLWQHETPIGLVSLSDSPTALLVKGKLSLGTQAGRDALALMQDRVVRGLSIGYETLRESYKDGVRHLLELKLWECSLVTFPMLPEAVVTSVKAVQRDQRLSALMSFRGEILEALQKKGTEIKSGRTISAATKTSLSAAHEHIKSAADILSPLLEDETYTTDDGAGMFDQKGLAVLRELKKIRALQRGKN